MNAPSSRTVTGLVIALAAVFSLALHAAATAGGPAAFVTVLDINAPIGPATSRYVVRGLETAQANGSRVVVLETDRPGGLDTARRGITRAISASPVRVAS